MINLVPRAFSLEYGQAGAHQANIYQTEVTAFFSRNTQTSRYHNLCDVLLLGSATYTLIKWKNLTAAENWSFDILVSPKDQHVTHIFIWIPICIFWSSFSVFLLFLTSISSAKVMGTSTSEGSVKIKNEKDQKAHLWPRSLLSSEWRRRVYLGRRIFLPLVQLCSPLILTFRYL